MKLLEVFLWIVFVAIIIGVVIYNIINISNKSNRPYTDPDRHPFQDIPGQEIIPGEKLYA